MMHSNFLDDVGNRIDGRSSISETKLKVPQHIELMQETTILVYIATRRVVIQADIYSYQFFSSLLYPGTTLANLRHFGKQPCENDSLNYQTR